MSTPMRNEGIWQRFVNVVDPPKWVDIDPSEKDEWERLGYPVRELVPATTLSSQAAEIAELKNVIENGNWGDKWRKRTEAAEAEIAELRKINAKIVDFQRENDRLRKALEAAALGMNHALMVLPLPEAGAQKRGWASLVEARDIVEAALTRKEG